MAFTLALTASLFATLWVSNSNQQVITQSLESEAQKITKDIIERVVLYQYGLRGARGAILTAGEQGISRDIFKRYNSTRDVDVEFPGARGFGFIRRVMPEDETGYVARTKQKNWADFSIRQLTPHDGERYVIELVEPIERNRTAIGLDIASETHRQQAAYSALLTGETHLSGPITLVQVTGKPLQSFLILQPIYRTGTIPATAQLREQEAFGWSYAPLVIDEILAGLNLAQQSTKLELVDVTDSHAAVPFYQTHLKDDTQLSDYKAMVTEDVFGRKWTISATAYPAFIANMHLTHPSLVLIYGLIVSLLLAGLVAFYGFNRQHKHLLLADTVRRANILEHSLDAIISFDCEGYITSWNRGAETIFGYQESDVIGRKSFALILPNHAHNVESVHFEQVLAGKPVLNYVGVHQDKQQRQLSTSLTALAIYNEFGEVVGVSQTIRDITAQQDAQRQILELNASLERKVQLRTAENKTLFDTINQQLLYSETDTKGIILVVNDNFCQATGYSREQLLGNDHALVSSGEHDRAFWDTLWQTINSGQSWHGEICNHDSQGQPKWFDTVIAPIFNKDHQVQRFVALGTDITERKHAQIEKNKVGSLLSAVLYAASEVSIIATDEQGTITLFNRGAELLLGYRKDEVIGKTSPAIFHLADEVEERGDELSLEYGTDIRGFEVFVYHAKNLGPETQIWTYVSKDGSQCQVSLSVSVMRDRQENIIGYLGVATNIDMMLSQQEALIAVSTQLSKAAEVAELGIWSLNLKTDELEWNERMFTMYDHPLSLAWKGVTYSHWLMRLHPDDVDMAEASMANAIKYKDTYAPIFRIIITSGEVRYIQAGAHINYDKFGTPTKVVGINRDITEQRELEQTLRLAKEAADADNAAKSAFLANMSHEIRTPMNAILGMLQLVQHTDMTAQQHDYVSKTEVAANSLLGLLNDILDFSKIDAGKLELDLHACSLEFIMRELAVLLAANMRKKQIEVIFDLDPSTPDVVLADKLRLQQVLVNLTGNAIKFTATGHVIVRVQCLSLDSTEVHLSVSVEDTGIGVSESQIDKIFQGFMQAESSTSRRFGGTGLGLAITKRLVELMGAELNVESKVGEGSRFWFEIRLALVEPQLQTAGISLSNRRVLLVDDSAMNRRIVAKTLTTHGAQVIEANGGIEALSLIEQSFTDRQAFDAVVMDWRMPDLNGLEAADRIHELCGECPEPAVIMLTAYAEDLIIASKAYSNLPFVSLLTKPTTAKLIVETLDSAISGAGIKALSKKQGQVNLLGMSILVVEDNELNRQVIDELLRLQGAKVTLAEGGIEGVKQVTDNLIAFDLVIMDMQMPDIDGLEATRRIRADGRFNGLPILAMTANASAADRESCLAAGMDDHVGKPIDMSLLIPCILRLTGRSDTRTHTAPDTVLDTSSINSDSSLPEDVAVLEDADAILRRFGGEMGFFIDVKKSFVSEMTLQLTLLEQAFEDDDFLQASIVAHTIKGTASNLGAKRLAAYGAQLELCCKQGLDPLASQEWLEIIGQSIAHSAQGLDNLFSTDSANINVRPQSLIQSTDPQFEPQFDPQALQALIPLLEDNNLDALDKLTDILPQVQLAGLWLELESQVNNLQFSDALVTVQAILKGAETCS